MTTAENIKVELITPEEAQDVLDFVLKDFLMSEPLCCSMNMQESPGVEGFVVDSLKQGNSFKAVDTSKNNLLVGVRLNKVVKKCDKVEEKPKPSDSPKDDKFDLIGDLLDMALTKCDLFNKYNVDSFLEGKLLGVRKEYRGRNIAGLMMEATMDFMRREKIPLIYISSSSFYTMRVLEKLGFEKIFQIPYQDYLVNGERVFYPQEPHKAFTSCMKFVR